MTAPRLLTPGQARRYVGGADPDDYAAPRGTRAGVRYDRAEIDRALDERHGLARASASHDPDAALADWIASDGAA